MKGFIVEMVRPVLRRRCAVAVIAWLLAACSATAPAPVPPPPPAPTQPPPAAQTQPPPKAQAQPAAPTIGLRNTEPARAPETSKRPPEPPKTAPASAPPAHPAAPKGPAPTGKPPAPPKPSPVPDVARTAPAQAPLDLKSLEERLKETSSIGVLTKLSLKNQVDDLVERFRAYHAGTRPPTLAELRPSFELLLMKVLSLLQDKDPSLAHDINVSRDAIWAVLSDRQKFAQFS